MGCPQHPGGVVGRVVRRSIFVRFDAERRGRAGRLLSLDVVNSHRKHRGSGGDDWSVRNWRLSVRLCGFSVGCQRSPWAPPAWMEPTRVPRAPGPRLIFLVATLALTFAATGLLCGAIMSDHWEEVGWDKEALSHANVTLTWYLDGQVALLEPPSGHRNHHTNRRSTFLVPMYGGIWIMCVSLTEEEIRLLGQVGFPQERCINYLTPDEAHEEIRAAWQNRMQNLSISCSLVCLIILGTAVLIGFFGLCRHQISAVLVTGVMYLLAATFALFTLTIIHFKRAQDRGARILDGPEDGVIGGPAPRNVLKARRFTSSWSMDFGWGGVTLCALASVAWILLSKIMRFSPIAAMIA